MANIDVGSRGGKRSLAPEVALVPMIDLLLCCSVAYREVMAAMDTAIGAGFADVTFAP